MDAAVEALPRKSGWPKGKPKSPETRARMSAAQKGKTRSPETRARISAASKAAWAVPAWAVPAWAERAGLAAEYRAAMREGGQEHAAAQCRALVRQMREAA